MKFGLNPAILHPYGRRQYLVQAQPVKFSQFQFSQWVDQEKFSIAIASMFADSEDKEYVLNLAASLLNEATTTTEDNGFTQKATIKAGLAHKSAAIIKSRVKLAPYRTFPEIQQPESEFVFRARCGDGASTPTLMLVEADGGSWKVNAIATLRRALEAFDLNIPIIA